MLKQMKLKGGRHGRKIPKRSITGVSHEEIVPKHPYREETAKLTDRLVPKLTNFGDL